MKTNVGSTVTVVTLLLAALLLSGCGTFEIEPEPLAPTAEILVIEDSKPEAGAEGAAIPATVVEVAAVQPTPTAEAVEESPTEEVEETPPLLTYENREYGFALDYPRDWSVSEVDDTDFVGPGSRSVQFSQGTITLVIGYRRVGEEVRLQGSGAPAGDLETRGSVQVGEQQVSRTVLVYEGQDKALFYGLGSPITIGALQFVPRMDDFRQNYDEVDLPAAIEGEADRIVGSLRLLRS
ncbi:MAG: hypothetical protein R3300_05895 [Candidatus Promineifilaceae bacterium]|nr:hypothetical protein [Candidatus Promineifilaceae bacterium]